MNQRIFSIVAVVITTVAVVVFGLNQSQANADRRFNDKRWVCHPVNGKGETGNGWDLIRPAQASKHIIESEYPNGHYWKHESRDGRHDVYAEGQTCPGGSTSTPTPTVTPTVTPTPTTTPTAPPPPPPVVCPSGYNRIFGTHHGDTLTGTNCPDVILGHGGNDRLFGLAANDTLLGGRGDDRLVGGDGRNALRGGLGIDTCIGNPNDLFISCEHIRRG